MPVNVSAINNSLSNVSFGQKHNKKSGPNVTEFNRENTYNKTPISNDAMTRATKNMLIGLMMLPTVSAGLQSCDKEAFAYSESKSEAIAKDSCCHNCNGHHFPIPGRDTITIHDTITNIITNYDTIYIKNNFDSPVIDSLRHFFEINDIPLGDKRIPLKITWVDELSTDNRPQMFEKMLFNGHESSRNELVYDNKSYPWSDEEGTFMLDSIYADPSKIKYSLTSEGRLLMMRYVPRNSSANLNDADSWVFSNAAIYDLNEAPNTVVRYKRNDDNSITYIGTFRPGDKDKSSIFVKNAYDTDWRYSNVKVVCGDAPDDIDD